MGAHTPGTWAVVRPTDDFGHPTVCAFDGDPADGIVSEVVAEILSDAEGDPDLIAAAPVMYGALGKIAALDQHSGASLRDRAASEIARASLANIGGRSDG